MNESLGETHSLCPVCLTRIPARRVVDNDNVYLEKTCAEHGYFKTLIWRGAALYKEWGKFGIDLGSPRLRHTNSGKGCPFDCGLCPQHLAETCVAIIEVTSACNLNCPFCFASAGGRGETPAVTTIEQMYQTLIDSAGPTCPVQLSGGEPTVRDDLPELIAMGKQMGFGHVQVNTNGLRIAEDRDYLVRLKEAGASVIYLQFDGIGDDVYLQTRGRELFATKLRAIENCAEAKMGVMLVPTLVPGVNMHQIGKIIDLATSWIPVVKGIHFQPVTYVGRYGAAPRDEDRVTIPDVLAAIDEQTGGRVKARHFAPRRRKESYCAFGGFFILTEDNRLTAMSKFGRPLEAVGGMGQLKKEPYEQARSYVSDRWRYVQESEGTSQARPGSWESFFERAKTHYLSITCMPFQDVWSIDLDRVTRCCTQVVTSDRRIIPFCAYYLTDTAGRRLHSED